MELTLTDYACMYRETVGKLDVLARSVREGKSIHEASNFARWLRFSGFLRIFEAHACSDPHFLVDPRSLDKKIADLLFDCGEFFRTNKVSPKYHESDIAEINHKLDQLLLTADLARPSSGMGVEPLPTKPRAVARRGGRAMGPRSRRPSPSLSGN